MSASTGPKQTTATVISNLRYRDCAGAVAWLTEAFGFETRAVHQDGSGRVVHAELTFGNGMIMIGPVSETPFSKYMAQPDEVGGRETQCIYAIVENPDAHCARAQARGAKIISAPEDKPYGGRDYGCQDLEGHLWWFGTYDPWTAK